MAGLHDPLTVLPGIGQKRQELFLKIGVATIEDLLRLYPRRYQDLSGQKLLSQCEESENAIISAVVLQKMPPAFLRKGMTLYKAMVSDGMTRFPVTIFNSKYTFQKLEVGETYLFSGRVTPTGRLRGMTVSAVFPPEEAESLRPIYPLTENLSLQAVQSAVKQALARYLPLVEDPLPNELLELYSLMPLQQALYKIHCPEDFSVNEAARKRLVFEELFFLSLALLHLKGRDKTPTEVLCPKNDLSKFLKLLPFTPTNAQKRAINEIAADLKKPIPMNRLLQGDVGSGKTLVAAAACYIAIQNGYQAALMAPTEILAAQHYATLQGFLEPLGVKIRLLTGSMTAKQKDALRQEIKEGGCDLVVGTHALVQQATEFHRLGLVVTDEQHRFGVSQRQALADKGDHPHHLVMSATPIPRTLALIVYGDLDLSILDELPKGRLPVETYSVHSDKRARALRYIRGELQKGHQAYIVCPLIEEGVSELKAATVYKEEIQRDFFPEYKVGLLHGRMSAAEKEEVMAAFLRNEIHLLVSTTVIEVGVDVKNATIMMIENAERFGLSQLHQLRGRIGRGEFPSTCILVSDNDGEENRKRLSIMKASSDGFYIAKEDLKMRGAGDFFGTRQHGLPALGIADLIEDSELFHLAKGEAEKLHIKDPELIDPAHSKIKEQITKIFGNHDNGRN